MKSMCHDRAPELAVGHGPQADLLLHPDGVADRVVLDRAELLRGDAPRGRVLPRAQQRRRAEQAADVVGAERWLGADCHGHSSSTAARRRLSRFSRTPCRVEPEPRFYIIAPRTVARFDLHAHVLPDAYVAGLTLPDGRPFPLPPAPRDALFETMERFGIDGAVVSTARRAPSWATPAGRASWRAPRTRASPP